MMGGLRIKFLGFFDILYGSLVLLCTILYFSDNEGISFDVYKFMLLLFFIYLVFYFRVGLVQNRSLFGSLVLSSYILLLSLLIVNLQTILNVLVGLAPITYYVESKYAPFFGKVFFIGIIAIASFMRGNLVTYSKKIPKIIKSRNDSSLLRKMFVLLSCFSFVMFVVNIDVVEFLTGADYKGSGADSREISSSSYWEMLFDVFNTITIGLYTYSKRKEGVDNLWRYVKVFPIVFALANFLYMTLRMLSGDRGALIYTFLLFAFSYVFLKQKKIKNIVVIAFLLMGVFTISTLNIFRNLSSERDLADKIEYSLNERGNELEAKSISPSSQELASSILCNFIAIHDIEKDKTTFKMGEYNFFELFGSIPGSNFIYSSITGKSFFRNNTTEYITVSHSGKHYDIGLGTTAIADFYLDFGFIGVVLGFLLMGAVFKYIDIIINCNKENVGFIGLLMVLKIASMAVYIPRSSFSFVLSRAMYCVIVYSVLYLAITLRKQVLSNGNTIRG